eukprot:TRINITY_DN5043_c1_g1_i1.p1 TRINITY_DN5043_c1_g1~~TRINITY_DN5043_c1_g1_i1.p1  ORF type:complete len:217 (-),score=37.63 TRINITY_DN5043_c1_g1_i1:89-739(-)
MAWGAAMSRSPHHESKSGVHVGCHTPENRRAAQLPSWLQRGSTQPRAKLASIRKKLRMLGDSILMELREEHQRQDGALLREQLRRQGADVLQSLHEDQARLSIMPRCEEYPRQEHSKDGLFMHTHLGGSGAAFPLDSSFQCVAEPATTMLGQKHVAPDQARLPMRPCEEGEAVPDGHGSSNETKNSRRKIQNKPFIPVRRDEPLSKEAACTEFPFQ